VEVPVLPPIKEVAVVVQDRLALPLALTVVMAAMVWLTQLQEYL
jgi:hypothetical protein